MRKAIPIALTPEENGKLATIVRSAVATVRDVQRARIVLLAAAGLIDHSTPKELDLHLIADNYATHKHQKVKEWLVQHPHFQVHFIPTSSSWLNAVERFFAELTQKRLRCGVFCSVLDLITAINADLEEQNQQPKPFIWTKTADQILEKLEPLYTNNINGS